VSACMPNLKNRIPNPRPNLPHNRNRRRIETLPQIDANREFAHAALARNGSKSSVSAASISPVLNTEVSFSMN
jgi:hypothetical protein